MDVQTLKKVISDHALWLVRNGEKRANFTWANLSWANLSKANLSKDNLVLANLSNANLTGAYLTGADLSGANLTGANLTGADLSGANLTGANLYEANLSKANLTEANLTGANLTEANLTGANLTEANLTGANLTETCLAADAPVPPLTDDEITSAGLEIRGDQVWGWRTDRSQHCGDTHYTTRKEPYVASVFSVDTQTECHPGIYLAGLNWLIKTYPNSKYVRCYCLRSELVPAENKWRCKRLWVVEN